MTKQVTFIGTEDLSTVSQEDVELFKEAIKQAVKNGYEIRSGASPGACRLAVEYALGLGGSAYLVLPRWDYANDWRQELVERFPGQTGGCYYETGVIEHHVVRGSTCVVALPAHSTEGLAEAERLGIRRIDLSTEKGRAAFRK